MIELHQFYVIDLKKWVEGTNPVHPLFLCSKIERRIPFSVNTFETKN